MISTNTHLAKYLVNLEEWFGRNVVSIMFEKGKKMLLIIGHMRSGSSLLVHILSSNSKIVGYGETHNQYRNKNDFGVVASKICRKTRNIPIKSDYFLDKVLHSEHFEDISILNHPSVRIIFQIRRPDHALSSIIRNTKRNKPKEAYSHYSDQLSLIKSISNRLPRKKWIYVRYKSLIFKTSSTFEKIERFLDLSEQLEESYTTSRFTGKSGVGDPGPNIRKGKIKRNIDYEVEPSVSPFIDKSEKKLEKCIKQLEKQK